MQRILTIGWLLALGAVLLSGCDSLLLSKGERQEKRVAYLQESLSPVPLVMSWPVTPVPEPITAVHVDEGWYYAEGQTHAIYAFTLDDGILQWVYRGFSGPLDTPPVHNQSSTFLVSQERCVAVDHLTGRPYWRTDLGGASTSPVEASETHLYAGTYARNLQAYNTADGHWDWFISLGSGVVSSRPVYVEPRVFFATEGGALYSLNAGTGEATGATGVILQTQGAVVGDLWVNGDNVYVPSWDGTLYCVDRLAGKTRWEYQAVVPLSQGALTGGGLVYLRADNGIMYAFDEASGGLAWQIPDVERHLAVVDGNAYFLRGQRTILRVDPATGEVLGQLRLDGWDFFPSNPEGSKLVLATRDGYIYSLERLELR